MTEAQLKAIEGSAPLLVAAYRKLQVELDYERMRATTELEDQYKSLHARIEVLEAQVKRMSSMAFMVELAKPSPPIVMVDTANLKLLAQAVMAEHDEETTGSSSLDNLINAVMALPDLKR